MATVTDLTEFTERRYCSQAQILFVLKSFQKPLLLSHKGLRKQKIATGKGFTKPAKTALKYLQKYLT